MELTKPLRDEHRDLLPHVEGLRLAGDALVNGDPAFPELLSDAVAFLNAHLIPHAMAEEAALYPEVERLMSAPGATATMTRDHVDIGAMTAELTALRERLGTGAPTPGERRDLLRLLYGLYALVEVHFAKEEEIYVPVLEAGLTPPEADAMFTRMHAAAHGHHH